MQGTVATANTCVVVQRSRTGTHVAEQQQAMRSLVAENLLEKSPGLIAEMGPLEWSRAL